MNTNIFTENTKIFIAESYYAAMLAKDFEKMGNYLHKNVHFIGPLSEMHDKESVVSAAKNLMQILENINIRGRFESGNEIMLAYDFIFPNPINTLRAAVLMQFSGDLISKIELFYDGRPFVDKQIFND